MTLGSFWRDHVYTLAEPKGRIWQLERIGLVTAFLRHVPTNTRVSIPIDWLTRDYEAA